MPVIIDAPAPWERLTQVQTIDDADRPPGTYAFSYPKAKGDPVSDALTRGLQAVQSSEGGSADTFLHRGLSGWANLTSTPLRQHRLPLREHFVRIRFHTLAEHWKRSHALTSSATRMFSDPAYRAIVALGAPVVPLLLRELEREPNLWFAALKEITGADPVPVEARGRLREMAEAWLRWGRENGVRW